MIRKYQNHKPQTTLWHREEEPLNHHGTPGRQFKQSNQLSLQTPSEGERGTSPSRKGKLLHNVSFHKRTVRASPSRMIISVCVFLTGKRETRPMVLCQSIVIFIDRCNSSVAYDIAKIDNYSVYRRLGNKLICHHTP